MIIRVQMEDDNGNPIAGIVAGFRTAMESHAICAFARAVVEVEEGVAEGDGEMANHKGAD